MGEDGFAFRPPARERSGGGSRRRGIKKTFNNLKITVLCGLVTILVLRGTIGVGNLAGPADADSDQKVVEDIDRILREIRSDSEPDDEPPPDSAASNSTTSAAGNMSIASAAAWSYTLGPKISDWEEQRRRWLVEHPEFPSRLAGGKPPDPPSYRIPAQPLRQCHRGPLPSQGHLDKIDL